MGQWKSPKNIIDKHKQALAMMTGGLIAQNNRILWPNWQFVIMLESGSFLVVRICLVLKIIDYTDNTDEIGIAV